MTAKFFAGGGVAVNINVVSPETRQSLFYEGAAPPIEFSVRDNILTVTRYPEETYMKVLNDIFGIHLACTVNKSFKYYQVKWRGVDGAEVYCGTDVTSDIPMQPLFGYITETPFQVTEMDEILKMVLWADEVVGVIAGGYMTDVARSQYVQLPTFASAAELEMKLLLNGFGKKRKPY